MDAIGILGDGGLDCVASGVAQAGPLRPVHVLTARSSVSRAIP